MSQKVVLLDIEGTTTPVSFVYDVLFPYASRNVRTYLDEHWDELVQSGDIEAFRAQAAQDAAEGRSDVTPIPPDGSDPDAIKEAVLANVLAQMKADRKVTCLKTLQGKIWRDGYESGGLWGQVFPDVSSAFARWRSEGNAIYIYSSGSIEAQQLLFRHSLVGNLTPFISGYFDTTTGPKLETDSYRKIAEAIGVEPAAILFATDVVAEAEAASKAGCRVLLVTRPGNAEPGEHSFDTAADFSAV